jgi:hypothetical protein
MPADQPTPTAAEFARELVEITKNRIAYWEAAEHETEIGGGFSGRARCRVEILEQQLNSIRSLAAAHGVKIEGGE